MDKTLENADLACTKTDNKTKYDFNRFSLPLKFIEKIHNYEITLDEAINDQTKLNILMSNLKKYNPKSLEKIEEKKRVLESSKKLQNARKDIIDFFEKGIFPYRGDVFKTKEEEESKENKFFKQIENETKDIDHGMFSYYFNFVEPSDLAKKLFEIKDKKKNNDFVEEIKNRWSKLKDEIEEMSEKNKKESNKILKIVEEIIKFNKQKQSGEGIKILTPNQMLSRLPISLAQLEAGNSSNKRKNELCSLYRSKNMTKQVYNNLIKHI